MGDAGGNGWLDAGDTGSADLQGDAAMPLLAGRRLPLPCTAPLPTGFCLESDNGVFLNGNKSRAAGGPTSVTIRPSPKGVIGLSLQDGSSTSGWSANFAPETGRHPVPGLYDPAQRYPFQAGGVAGLSVEGNGTGCNMLTGKFSIEELARHPLHGITRFSATFEQRCEGGTAALRGVVNFQATGAPDPTPAPERVINFSGKIFRIAYDASANVAYGLDATNRKLAKIDLTSGSATYASVVQVPHDVCVDVKRGRLFVVNKGSTLITEYNTSDLKAVRDISWVPMDWGPTETRFKIYCARDRLYVTDGAWAPGLFTVDGLDDATPQVTNRTADASGVGGLVSSSTATDIYYWYQYGWGAGLISTSVRRLMAANLSKIDETSLGAAEFHRDPLDAPILLDETRGLVFAKNKIFDASNLAKVVFTLPSPVDTFAGAGENAYALDPKRGLIATKSYVYELSRYDIVVPTVVPAADQVFFDTNGALWFLSIADGALKAQVVTR